MRYLFNTAQQIDGSLPPEAWHTIDADNHDDALRIACLTLSLKQLPITVHIATDKLLHTNGVPMMTKAYTLEVTQ